MFNDECLVEHSRRFNMSGSLTFNTDILVNQLEQSTQDIKAEINLSNKTVPIPAGQAVSDVSGAIGLVTVSTNVGDTRFHYKGSTVIVGEGIRLIFTGDGVNQQIYLGPGNNPQLYLFVRQ
jgi:hypothetical protein